jgi:bacteriophage N4 adsorption protein B
MILSGLDDLFLDSAFLLQQSSRRRLPAPPPAGAKAESRIALWVPAWHEAEVIAQMLTHNTASIRYPDYHIFAGTYPNDEATLDVLREVEPQYPNLHVCLTPHDGPTSKADNLNWIYQNQILVEERLGHRFDIVVIHDSEDLIHPEEFRWLDHYVRNEGYDFVQIPVLGLPTPWWHLTHGTYCDEFAETQQKDLPTRNRLGGFSPSCGVGTGYRREALAKMADAEHNRLFDPDSLTEDYLNGLRMHRLGMRQIYLPVHFLKGHPVATREFFPQSFWPSVRQRTRWVTGIALQTWQKVGWSRSFWENYWFWRDRKGLLGNPLSLLANFLLVLGLLGFMPSLDNSPLGAAVLPAATIGFVLQCYRTLVRMISSGRIYGLVFALTVPVRIPWSNLINSLATCNALYRYAKARLRNERLSWLKTEHNYPNKASLMPYTRRLGEVLCDRHLGTHDEIEEAALAAKAAGQRLGEYLMGQGKLSEAELYQALSILSAIPFEPIDPASVDVRLARCFPRDLLEAWQLLPLRLDSRTILLATPEIPRDNLLPLLSQYTHRDLVFQLITPTNYRSLQGSLDPEAQLSSAA